MTHFYSILLCSPFSVENQVRHGNVRASLVLKSYLAPAGCSWKAPWKAPNPEVDIQPATSSVIPEVTSKNFENLSSFSDRTVALSEHQQYNNNSKHTDWF